MAVSIWTAASPSHSMAYTRLVLTGVQEIKGKAATYQMHWGSSSASRNIFKSSFHFFVIGDRFLLDHWHCSGLGLVLQQVMELGQIHAG